ncbi:MAG: FKBP-type peptidyl-prolyl cis-trans isomerase [Planctomycetota bacterium]
MIGGWTEGMQLVAPGGRILLICPPDLAYGQRGAPGAIPPNATLYFDVELFAVN